MTLMRFVASLLCALFASKAFATPCTHVDRSLSPERKAALATALVTQMNVAEVEILGSFRLDRWTILYVDPHQGDTAFLFYASDPSRVRYTTLWAGAARRTEADELRRWALSNARGVPAALAECFAWYATTARQQPVSGANKPKTLQVDGLSYALDVEISAGAVGDETLASGVYVFHLKCSAEISCGLERIALNECATARPGERAFSPRVDSWVTWTGQLAVRQTAPYEVELTAYQAFGQKLPARIMLSFAPGKSHPFEHVTGFRTEGFIDLRFWPDISRHIDYAPISNDRQKVLDCPMAVRGLR